MHRRGALAMLGGTVFLGGTLGVLAQPATSVRRIGILGLDVAPSPAEIQQFWASLRALGWIDGRNLVVEHRYAGGKLELLRTHAEELVRLNVDVIGTGGTAAAIAARNATSRIPIVMIAAGDPVRAGLVPSLAKPGGNITGYSTVSTELNAKRLTILHELLPAARRFGVLIGSANATFAIAREEYDRVYRSLGMHPVFVDVATADDIENAVAEVARQGAQALDIPVDGLFHSHRVVTMRAALRHALPTIVGDRAVLEAGGLISLSIDEAEIYPTFAYFLDKVLRGAKPADLPIQQPTRFVLAINLRTAKALGLTIPPTLLQRADEVIQ